MAEQIVLDVDAHGSAAFHSIAEALARLEELDAQGSSRTTSPRLRSARIRIAAGTFRERIEIRRPGLTVEGAGAHLTRIVGSRGARMPDATGEPLGTFRTYTVLVDADGITLRDLSIENDAGDGREVGQGIALYADGDQLQVSGCHLLGRQDTLFCGPLPLREIEAGGFRGPKRDAVRRVGRQLYQRCVIVGDVDFIFGGATALFENCEICSLDRDELVNGYVTAASTPQGRPYGFVFHRCRFTTDACRPCADGTVFLGRPWRDFARVALIDCELGSHIASEAWSDWDKPRTHRTIRYVGDDLHGMGFARDCWPAWTTPQLDEEGRLDYARPEVLGGWDPETCDER